VPEQLARCLAGHALTPIAPQQPVARFGLPFHRASIGAFRWLQDPPANELPADETGPEAESRNPGRGHEPTAMEDLDLDPGTGRAVAQVAHDLRVESSSTSYSRFSSDSGTSRMRLVCSVA
jgi:hypothetical protein